MPEVKVEIQNLARFSAGDFEIRQDIDGDLRVGTPCDGVWLSGGGSDIPDFIAVVRAYLAHIDATESADDGPPRVGDLVEVLVDNANYAGVRVGEQYVVQDTDEAAVSVRSKSDDRNWSILNHNVRVVRRKNGGAQ